MDWVTLVQQLGLPLAILVALGIGLVKSMKYAGEKIFDEKKGLLTLLIRSAMNHLNKISEAVDKGTESQKEFLESHRKIGFTLEAIRLGHERQLSALTEALGQTEFGEATNIDRQIMVSHARITAIFASKRATPQEIQEINRHLTRIERLAAVNAKLSRILEEEMATRQEGSQKHIESQEV